MQTATQTKRQGTTITMKAPDLAFGGQSGYHLESVGIPAARCETAAATCVIQIMGWHKGNHNGNAPRNKQRHALSGRWVHIQLATYGKRPNGPATHNWRGSKGRQARYIRADNFAAADYILGAFEGITVEEIIQWKTDGNGIGQDDRIEVSLREAVEHLRPALIALDAMLTASDNADEVKHDIAMSN